MSDYVIDIDKGWKQILKDSLKMENVQLKVGLFGDGNSPQSNLAYRGIIQELGARIKVTGKMRGFLHAMGFHTSASAINIPQRPFTREAFDKNKTKINNSIDKWYTDMVEGRITLKVFLQKVGELHKGQIKDSIRSGGWKPNHPFTIARKGSARPLIANGEMLNGVDYKIEGTGTI